jgi:nitroreductase
MNVSEAVMSRRSIRAFLERPVESSIIRKLLASSARAPSGGNVQPWRIFLLNGPAMADFRAFLARPRPPELPAYSIYPADLKSPYRDSRFKVGEDMYAKLGIPRDDKPARLRWLARNFDFFGAPAGFFCFVDRQMGPPQWSDLGMFLQTFMLLAREAGLDTCPQEAWAMRAESVQEFVGASAELMLFCGMAIGYRDPSIPVNHLLSDREPEEVWLREL